ncbi:uncharacterized protein MYCFIDRAFT_84721 [Pseudocercospora fijiensis CIRAD86]|uniref:Uncharacterized protein n=1 Tax=Pseudocercospora fijiensis (strain CIRAD86) TaxID=383855 RepID=M2ZY45_PSEFD|nr:uncharacterized protein MYCFIDRAFT_84721 [Pseudocercospora fijiensis CIRAD86]EME77041.1 hypothetical protein MYCFIDRAFT_84721 [Pseudocercospora fijiensis CIRAD86]
MRFTFLPPHALGRAPVRPAAAPTDPSNADQSSANPSSDQPGAAPPSSDQPGAASDPATGTKRRHDDEDGPASADEVDGGDSSGEPHSLEDIIQSIETSGDNTAAEADDDDQVVDPMAHMTPDILSLQLATKQTVEDLKQLTVEEVIQTAEYQMRDDDQRDDEPTAVPGQEFVEVDEAHAPQQQQQQQTTVMLPPARPSPLDQSEAYDQKKGCKVSTLSNLERAFGLWLQDVGISRSDYTSLHKIFTTLLPDSEIAPGSKLGELPKSIDTVKLHLKSVLPLLELRYQEIALQKQKTLPTASGKETTHRPLFFFNPQQLFTRILTSDIAKNMHSGLAYLTDLPTELCHSRAWASSIRTTSGAFARYPGQLDTISASRYTDEPARGPPPVPPQQKKKSRGRKTARVDEEAEEPPMPAPPVDWTRARAESLRSHYHKTSSTSLFDLLLQATAAFDPIYQAHPIRGELEIIVYGRKPLLNKLDAQDGVRAISAPYLMFMDSFGLYRNMRRSLMGWYITLAGLTMQERNRTSNMIPFTLGPHGSNTEDVIEAIAPCLRALEAGQLLDLLDGSG